jgi:hypothetical protein
MVCLFLITFSYYAKLEIDDLCYNKYLVLSIAPIYTLALFSCHFVPFSCCFKHLSYLHMEDHTFCETSTITSLFWANPDL